MVTDKNGKTYEHTTVTSEGHIIHHHGTKVLTKEQNKAFSEIALRVWNSLSDEKQKEINLKLCS